MYFYKLDNIAIYDIIMKLCGYGGIGSFELDHVLWTIKGKRKGAAVKISVALQDTKKFWAPQGSHVNLIFNQICGYGGIGRHARFRFLYRKVCRFKSCYPHQKKEIT